MLCVAALVAGASAFSPLPAGGRASTSLFNAEKGAGGMFDTRNPDPVQHEDARKSISVAPSFEEYMKMRDGGAAADPAPAPAAAPPAPAAPAPAAWAPPAAAPPAPPAPAAWAPPAAAPPAPAAHGSGAPAKGAGGMFDTRDPEPVQHEDARKSISAAPSFEEYMKQRGQ